MRDDPIQQQLQQCYEELKMLREEQAEADEIFDPVIRASCHDNLKYYIEHIERKIDELMRRA